MIYENIPSSGLFKFLSILLSLLMLLTGVLILIMIGAASHERFSIKNIEIIALILCALFFLIVPILLAKFIKQSDSPPLIVIKVLRIILPVAWVVVVMVMGLVIGSGYIQSPMGLVLALMLGILTYMNFQFLFIEKKE